MTGASEDLLQAVYGLRKAAEGQFTGNAYYQVTSEINELIELLGWGDGSVPVGQSAVHGFATMLDEVRTLAKTGTSGSLYSTITYKLDALAAYLTSATSAPAPVSEKPAVVAAPAPAAAPEPVAEPAPAVAEAPVPVAAPAPAAAPAKAPASVSPEQEALLQAVQGLRKAAEAEFTGNTYYQVSNEINELIELLGWGAGDVAPGQGAAYGFATMLAEVRKLAEASTSANNIIRLPISSMCWRPT